ncbi:MAG: hypothetical protein ACTSW1_07295 [Candidatus Hodarchaeales archaeon]
MMFTALAGLELYRRLVSKECRSGVRPWILRKVCANFTLHKILRYPSLKEPEFSRIVLCLESLGEGVLYE